MAYLTSVLGHGIGLVEFFKNPTRDEWRELWSQADPVDGVRGYLIGDDLYVWGSLPLHSDLRDMIATELASFDRRWIGVQINTALVTVLVTETIDRAGVKPPDLLSFDQVSHAQPLLRLLGRGMIVRRLDQPAVEMAEA